MTYRTEPLQTYDLAKEARLNQLRSTLTAREEGKLLVVGNMNSPKELIAGIGDFAFLAGEPWAVFIVREGGPELVNECNKEVERRGYARDLCSYMRLSWGSCFLNRSPLGPYPKPDFVIAFNQCDSQARWHQVEAKHLGVPFFPFDYSFKGGDGTLKLDEHRIQYLTGQFDDFCHWLEKFTGRKYDDEKLVAAMANSHRSRCLWAEICQLQETVPAPLEYKLLLPFFLALEYHSYKKETVDLLATLRDEVRYRVENGITPLPNEQFRVLHEGLAPWYALHLFSYLRENGVAVIAAPHHFQFAAAVQQPAEDGGWNPDAPIQWEDIPRTREEAFRHRAIHHAITEGWTLDPRIKLLFTRGSLRAWKADADIFMFDRGCELFCMSNAEVKAAIQKDGIPTMIYETSRTDKRDWSWSQVKDTLDSFIEALKARV